MYIPRASEKLVHQYLEQFSSIGIMGPRQSGKSTMVRQLLEKTYTYLSFDDFEVKELFYSDPVKFISKYNNRVIFDEAQYMPELFLLIKKAIDEDRMNYGKFVIAGSGQFLMGKHFSESLAGRIGLIPLLPMQNNEINSDHVVHPLLYGGYPELVVRNYAGYDAWYNSYIQTYLQKDLRQMLNISDIQSFTRFIRLLAINIGQVLNLSALSRDIGISVTTLKRWLSVLENSYIVFLLHPYYRNLGKRIIKTPKIYFYDSGLVAFLTGISTIEQWEKGVMYGSLFENYIISDILKQILHYGLDYQLSFYRTNHGEEIDLIIDRRSAIDLVEIKASVTYRSGFQSVFSKINLPGSTRTVVYQGDDSEKTDEVKARNFNSFLSDFKSSFVS